MCVCVRARVCVCVCRHPLRARLLSPRARAARICLIYFQRATFTRIYTCIHIAYFTRFFLSFFSNLKFYSNCIYIHTRESFHEHESESDSISREVLHKSHAHSRVHLKKSSKVKIQATEREREKERERKGRNRLNSRIYTYIHVSHVRKDFRNTAVSSRAFINAIFFSKKEHLACAIRERR